MEMRWDIICYEDVVASWLKTSEVLEFLAEYGSDRMWVRPSVNEFRASDFIKMMEE